MIGAKWGASPAASQAAAVEAAAVDQPPGASLLQKEEHSRRSAECQAGMEHRMLCKLQQYTILSPSNYIAGFRPVCGRGADADVACPQLYPGCVARCVPGRGRSQVQVPVLLILSGIFPEQVKDPAFPQGCGVEPLCGVLPHKRVRAPHNPTPSPTLPQHSRAAQKEKEERKGKGEETAPIVAASVSTLTR